MLGHEVFDVFIRDNMEEYLDLLREFESKKRTIKPEKTGNVNLLIPFVAIDTLCREHLGMDLKATVAESSFKNVISVHKDKLRIDADIFIGLFKPTIDSIIEIISKVLQAETDIDVSQLILVGGLSECLLVQSAVKNNFPKYQVIIPMGSELAVLKGATIYGHRPCVITERIARYTYGFGKRKPFDPDKHDESHLLITDDGRKMAVRLFDAIIKRNEVIPVGKKMKKTGKSRPDNDGVFTLKLYQSDKEDPLYIDEDGCDIVGKVTLKKTDPTSRVSITAEYIFGETELGIIIIETPSDRKSRPMSNGILEI